MSKIDHRTTLSPLLLLIFQLPHSAAAIGRHQRTYCQPWTFDDVPGQSNDISCSKTNTTTTIEESFLTEKARKPNNTLHIG